VRGGMDFDDVAPATFDIVDHVNLPFVMEHS
jgi:hypothetical protein